MAAAATEHLFPAHDATADQKSPYLQIASDDDGTLCAITEDSSSGLGARRCVIPPRLLGRSVCAYLAPVDELHKVNQGFGCKHSATFELALQPPPPPYAPPPAYNEAILDNPPDYTTTDTLAQAQTFLHEACPQPVTSLRRRRKSSSTSERLMPTSAFIDWNDQTWNQNGGNKGGAKKKKKGGAGDGWGSDNEGKKEDGAAGEGEGGKGEEGGEGGAGGNGGTGGDGGEDNGGEDWGGFNVGKKNKKNKKKNKGDVDDEEEEKKRKEEEEAKNALSWADDSKPPADDNWGFAAGSKKKKDKKKSKNDVGPPADNTGDGGTTNFDDINLEDDGAPKVNLTFGSGGGKDPGSSFDIGGWGNTWGKGTWAPPDTGTAGAGDTKALKDTNPSSTDSVDLGWGFGDSKTKKQSSTIGAGFDFGDFSADHGPLDSVTANQDDPKPEEDISLSFGAKKDKKKKKDSKLVDEAKDSEKTAKTETRNDVDDTSGGAWGHAKKSKKKGKGAESEEAPPVLSLPSDPPPTQPADDWLTPITTGNKKKGKKGVAEEAKADEPAVIVVPEQEAEADEPWGAWGKKDKDKKKKKGEEDVSKETPKKADPFADSGGWEAQKETKDPWGSGSKKEKERDKKKKGTEKEEAGVTVPEFETTADFSLQDDTGGGGGDDLWTSFGTKDKDKDKKKGKGMETLAKDSDPIAKGQDDSFGVWGTTAKGKNKKKGAKEETKDEPRKDVKEETTAMTTDRLDGGDDSGSWGTNSKKKKDKKAAVKEEETINEEEPIPVPLPSAPVESAEDGIWGAVTTKKGKKAPKKPAFSALPDPEPVAVVPELEQEHEAEKEADDDWGNSWGLTSKDKKKKEKEKKKEEEEKKKKKEEEEKKTKEEEEKKRKEEEEEARRKDEEEARKKETEEAKKKEEDKKLKKGGKKAATSKTKEEVVPTPVPEPPSALGDDMWGGSIWGSAKKKGKAKKDEFDVPPPVPTPPAMGLTPEPEEQEQDEWTSMFPKKTIKGKNDSTKTKDKDKDKSKGTDLFSALDEPDDFTIEDKEPSKEETTAKTVKSMLGSTTKSKLSKDKEKEKEKEKSKGKDKRDREEEKPKSDDLIDIIEEPTLPPAAKSSTVKGRTGSKLSKLVSKSIDKSNSKLDDKKADKKTSDVDALQDFGGDEPDTNAGKAEDDDTTASDKKAGNDAWNFWGSSKKTGVKKETEEIGKPKSANKKTLFGSAEITEPLSAEKQLEDAMDDDGFAEESMWNDPKPLAAKSKMKSSVGKSSIIADRLKAFEKPKSKKAGETEREDEFEEPPPPPPLLEPQFEAPATKKSGTSKLNRTSTATKPPTSTSVKRKEVAPAPKAEQGSKDTVPGSFPDDYLDGDLADIVDAPPSPEKPKSKTTKSKSKREPEPPPEDNMDDLLMDSPVATAPPTPPPEPKPAKKERAKLAKDDGASSWGFWGAAPKKSSTPSKKTMSKDDADVVLPAKEKPSLGRSKSTRTPKEKEKEKEKEESRSSGGSDKDKEPKPRSRISRTNSFAGFFGSASPAARTKSVRRPSATPRGSSRRQSTADATGSGMPSPPLEDEPGLDDMPKMSSKAAKLMGVGSKDTRKSKGKAKKSVPDPYTIDDDDMVMVNPMEDPVINAPVPGKDKREKLSRSKPKRESKVLSDPNDDIVMVDGPSIDAPDVGFGDDVAFVEKPRDSPNPLRRSNTTSNKEGKGIMGLFGLRKPKQQSTEPSRALSGDEAFGGSGSRRKRAAGGPDDDPKRPRRTHRSEKTEDNEGGFTTDAGPAGGTTTEVEGDAEAARHEARRARREDKERSKARDSRRAELRELEEKKARRQLSDKAATEARKAKIRETREKMARGESIDEGGSASKDKERLRGGPDGEEREGDETVTERKPKLKRKSTKDTKDRPTETEDDRRARKRAERKTSSRLVDGAALPTRTRDEGDRRREKREKDGGDLKRRGAAPPVTDYFDARNARTAGTGSSDPYSPKGRGEDKTSSWVNSLSMDPPAPPPVEGTVLEPEPVLGSGIRGPNGDGEGDANGIVDEEMLSEGEEKRRRRRAERRKSRAERVLGEEEAGRRRRRAVDGEGGREKDGKRSSEGSDERGGGGRGVRRRTTGYGNAVGIGGGGGGGGMMGAMGGGGGNGAAGKRQSWFKKIAGM